MSKIKYKDINVSKTYNGLNLSTIVDGQLLTRSYVGFSVYDAKKEFRKYFNR